jgi:dihydropteroate synthase
MLIIALMVTITSIIKKLNIPHLMKEPVKVSSTVKKIQGRYDKYKDWVQDQKGYFLIKINKKDGVVELGYCRSKNFIEIIITGSLPQEIYFVAIEKGLVKRLDHAAYLGKELQKAYLALKYNLDYVQDEELKV